ncbi:hypothetical protein B0H17DRAFT_1130027 [Mycena rosella]|uniref:Uncharacterized protein n=1 Tax=Mycena rosella TaxID=1033263 RepID=A0AAD7DU55_MYCRO|nr:hypothetical protein B0H17DRAFT_1130027 [Mycena rosella]
MSLAGQRLEFSLGILSTPSVESDLCARRSSAYPRPKRGMLNQTDDSLTGISGTVEMGWASVREIWLWITRDWPNSISLHPLASSSNPDAAASGLPLLGTPHLLMYDLEGRLFYQQQLSLNLPPPKCQEICVAISFYIHHRCLSGERFKALDFKFFALINGENISVKKFAILYNVCCQYHRDIKRGTWEGGSDGEGVGHWWDWGMGLHGEVIERVQALPAPTAHEMGPGMHGTLE